MRLFLFSVVVLLVVLFAVDRVSVQYAEDRVAEQLQEHLGLTELPGVQIRGFPVLTQAVAGSYRDVRLTVARADLGELSHLDAEVRLSGVKIPLSDLLSGDIQTIPVDVVAGTVSIPYEEVAAQIGAGIAVENSDKGVVVTQTIEVLGQRLEVAGTGRLRVESSDQIGVTVVGLSVAGVDLPEQLVEQLQQQLSFTYTVPPLPFGLRITDVSANDDGFDISAQAENAVLAPL